MLQNIMSFLLIRNKSNINGILRSIVKRGYKHKVLHSKQVSDTLGKPVQQHQAKHL